MTIMRKWLLFLTVSLGMGHGGDLCASAWGRSMHSLSTSTPQLDRKHVLYALATAALLGFGYARYQAWREAREKRQLSDTAIALMDEKSIAFLGSPRRERVEDLFDEDSFNVSLRDACAMLDLASINAVKEKVESLLDQFPASYHAYFKIIISGYGVPGLSWRDALNRGAKRIISGVGEFLGIGGTPVTAAAIKRERNLQRPITHIIENKVIRDDLSVLRTLLTRSVPLDIVLDVNAQVNEDLNILAGGDNTARALVQSFIDLLVYYARLEILAQRCYQQRPRPQGMVRVQASASVRGELRSASGSGQGL